MIENNKKRTKYPTYDKEWYIKNLLIWDKLNSTSKPSYELDPQYEGFYLDVDNSIKPFKASPNNLEVPIGKFGDNLDSISDLIIKTCRNSTLTYSEYLMKPEKDRVSYMYAVTGMKSDSLFCYKDDVIAERIDRCYYRLDNLSFLIFRLDSLNENELYLIPDQEFFGCRPTRDDVDFGAFCVSNNIIKLTDQISKFKVEMI